MQSKLTILLGYNVGTLWRVVIIQLEKILEVAGKEMARTRKVMVVSPCELDGWTERGDG
jgi:hypothetical protein